MRIWCLVLLTIGGMAISAEAAPLVYTGDAVTFEKLAFADETLPENQDFILNGVSITRASTRGIFNIAVEESYVDAFSPAGTRWAFPNNNQGEPDELSAANCVDDDCSAYDFADWQTANGGATSGPPDTVGQAAVLHLIDQNIYLDIRFTSWGVGSGSGGAFSYERAAITPSADFDRDGDVDGHDFLTWQRNYGSPDALQSEGDADFDGVVTPDDLIVWQDSYGGPLAAAAAVPEPQTILLLGFALLGVAALRRPK